MKFSDHFKKKLFNITHKSFESNCLNIFKYQFEECDIYHQYCNALNQNPENVQSVYQIPFLPIALFKHHAIKSGNWKEQKIFKSSGTTRTGTSFHYIKDFPHYINVAKYTFIEMFGNLGDLKFLALLPSYQEQDGSSLIEMVDAFIRESKSGSNCAN